MNIRCRTEFHQSKHDEQNALFAGGKQPVRRPKRAQILVAADAEIDERVVRGMSTVTRTN